MILQHIAASLRKRDWGTVVLEVLIVVVGIFIALQVDDWNAARKDRIEEAQFLSRLHDDILNSEALSGRVLERRIYYADKMPEVIDIMFGRQPADQWTQDHCHVTSATSSINIVVTEFSAVAELIAAGRMSIIQYAELRTAIVNLQQAQIVLRNIIDVSSPSMFILSAEFPELFSREAFAGDGEIRTRISCNFDAMRANPEFLNKFSYNMEEYDTYIIDGLRPWWRAFMQVHNIVDQELGLDHQTK